MLEETVSKTTCLQYIIGPLSGDGYTRSSSVETRGMLADAVSYEHTALFDFPHFGFLNLRTTKQENDDTLCTIVAKKEGSTTPAEFLETIEDRPPWLHQVC